MTVYGLRNCDSCRKAIRWLDDQAIDYRFVDIREHTPSSATLKQWHTRLGDGLLNRRGTTWRQLSAADKSRADKQDTLISLLQQQPALIKRPILATGESVLAGFDPALWQKAI